MRSLARLFSSSRRAPPNAASKPCASSACFSPSVFHMSVCSGPWSNGLMPCRSASGILVHDQLECRARPRPCRAARYMSLNFQVVSTCSSGNGSGPGKNAFLRQVQHHRRILADRIEHHRPRRLGDGLAQDVDALGLEPVEMRQDSHFWRRSSSADLCPLAARKESGDASNRHSSSANAPCRKGAGALNTREFQWFA